MFVELHDFDTGARILANMEQIELVMPFPEGDEGKFGDGCVIHIGKQTGSIHVSEPFDEMIEIMQIGTDASLISDALAEVSDTMRAMNKLVLGKLEKINETLYKTSKAK